jgi:hypothetical protein
VIDRHKDRVIPSTILPKTTWKGTPAAPVGAGARRVEP